jgi:hypothetical protein
LESVVWSGRWERGAFFIWHRYAPARRMKYLERHGKGRSDRPHILSSAADIQSMCAACEKSNQLGLHDCNGTNEVSTALRLCQSRVPYCDLRFLHLMINYNNDSAIPSSQVQSLVFNGFSVSSRLRIQDAHMLMIRFTPLSIHLSHNLLACNQTADACKDSSFYKEQSPCQGKLLQKPSIFR